MRGKVFDALDDSIKNGITPAYAGKRIARGRFNLLDQDHPRLCGEKAGGERTETQGDHPRLCGENFSSRSTKSNCPGSPPPMRGKVKYHGKGLYLHRITPAYAGKSYSTLGFQPFVRITPAYAGKRDSVKL